MKKLLGIINFHNEESFLLQENGTISLRNAKNFVTPQNYNLIKNRDSVIGNGKFSGETVFNFRYGPVTGGVAEAGIYNIYTTGEKILSVEIDVTYKRRGIEKKMVGKSIDEAVKMAENLCGNFAFSHSLAYAKTVEKISEIKVKKPVTCCRVIALELERIYNHFYVICELAKGAAQKVFTSHMQYLFEEMLRINAIFSGSRHLMNFNGIGTVTSIPDNNKIDTILKKLDEMERRFTELYKKSLESGNYLDRLHNTGIISTENAVKIGLTGPSLRASGIREDLREFEPDYGYSEISVKTEGDSLARMEVRAEEVFISLKIIKENLLILKELEKKITPNVTLEEGEGFGAVESPSGTICYFLAVKNGKIDYCNIVTPSLFGFKAIADSLAGQIFTDFVFTVESFGVNFADAAR